MLRKNTAGQHLGFALVNASTGAALTGATVAVHLVIDGGSQAAAGGTVTESGLGQYSFAPSQADTNGNNISYLFTATGAVPVEKTVVTTAANPTDANAFGLAYLDTNVGSRSTFAGGAVSSVTAGVVVTTNNDKTGYGLSSGERATLSGVILTDTTDTLGADIVALGTNVAAIYNRIGAPVGASISADIQTRSTYAGGAVASVTAPVSVSLSQTGITFRVLDNVADSSLTIGDAFASAIAGAAGKQNVSGTGYTIESPSTGTVIRNFTLTIVTGTPTSYATARN